MKISYQFMRTERVDFDSDFHISGYEDDPVESKVCSKFNARKNGGYPVYIIQHHTVADFERTVNLFTANKGNEMWNWGSAHYVIDPIGNIECMVDPAYRAYHGGVGYFTSGSKFNPNGSVPINDINSWSIGIENVNDGYSVFPKEQMYSNILLMEELVTTFPSINTKLLLGHADWDPSRKCDPNPYFDWELAAHAGEKFEEIQHNFGVYPTIQYQPDSQPIISGLSSDSIDPIEVRHVQEILAEIGYNVFAKDRSNEGMYDLQTKNCVKAFKNHYMNKSVVATLEDIRLYESYDDHDPFMVKVTNNTLDTMGEVADLLS